MENRTRICICYVVTAFLITAFVYSLVSTHFSSITRLNRLQYEVEEITKMILGRNPSEAFLPQMDSYIKKCTQGLWEELVAVKKKLTAIECSSTTDCLQDQRPATDIQAKIEEQPNYALESIGASVVHVEDEPFHQTDFLTRLLGIKHKSNCPGEMLDPSMQLGRCYAFKGAKSVFIIKLSHKIFLQAVTVEHISASTSLTGDISNAPKDFLVYGLESLQAKKDVLLGTFQYNNSMVRRAQTFPLINESNYKFCKMKVTSNHGNPNQTCIYRIAIHGSYETDQS